MNKKYMVIISSIVILGLIVLIIFNITNKSKEQIEGAIMKFEKLFELTKTRHSKEQYLNAAKKLDNIIKVLLLLIVIVEIIINYQCHYSGVIEIYIYNILFPFTLVYISLFVRSFRAEKEALVNKFLENKGSKVKSKAKNQMIKKISLKSEEAMVEITRTLSDLVLSIIIPYVILLFSNNQNNVLDLVVVIVLFILSTYVNFSKKYTLIHGLVISIMFLFGILAIIINNIFSTTQNLTSLFIKIIIIVCFFATYLITNKTIKS